MEVEATKFTEVGYVGRDVEQIVRDLIEIAITMVREIKRKEVNAQAKLLAEERVLDCLVGPAAGSSTRDNFRKKLRNNELDEKVIEIDVQDTGSMPTIDLQGGGGGGIGMINLNDMLGKAMGSKTKKKKITVGDSYEILVNEESDKLKQTIFCLLHLAHFNWLNHLIYYQNFRADFQLELVSNLWKKRILSVF